MDRTVIYTYMNLVLFCCFFRKWICNRYYELRYFHWSLQGMNFHTSIYVVRNRSPPPPQADRMRQFHRRCRCRKMINFRSGKTIVFCMKRVLYKRLFSRQSTPLVHHHLGSGNALDPWRIPYSGMLRRVALVRVDISEEHIASIIKVKRIGQLGTR
jgi:hypothetical protein